MSWEPQTASYNIEKEGLRDYYFIKSIYCWLRLWQNLIYGPGLPVDLQYLPEDKKREEDPDIRKMLLETLLLVQNHKHSETNTRTQIR